MPSINHRDMKCNINAKHSIKHILELHRHVLYCLLYCYYVCTVLLIILFIMYALYC